MQPSLRRYRKSKYLLNITCLYSHKYCVFNSVRQTLHIQVTHSQNTY